jgi:hypothetical protein
MNSYNTVEHTFRILLKLFLAEIFSQKGQLMWQILEIYLSIVVLCHLNSNNIICFYVLQHDFFKSSIKS